MNLGSRLKQILRERGVTVTQFAKDAGVPAQTVYALINRDSNKADMDILIRLLTALQMDVFTFMGVQTPEDVTADVPSAVPVKEKVVVKEVPAAVPAGTAAVYLKSATYEQILATAADEGITDTAVIQAAVNEYMEAGFGYRQRPLRSVLRDHKPSGGHRRDMDSYLL